MEHVFDYYGKVLWQCECFYYLAYFLSGQVLGRNSLLFPPKVYIFVFLGKRIVQNYTPSCLFKAVCTERLCVSPDFAVFFLHLFV